MWQDNHGCESDHEDAGTVDEAIVVVVVVVAIVTAIEIAAAPRVDGVVCELPRSVVRKGQRGYRVRATREAMVAGRGTRAAHWITTRERGILEADGVTANSKR